MKNVVRNSIHTSENIGIDDIPEITDFSSFKRSPRLAKVRERIIAEGRYYTRAFDYESGVVEITEFDSATHEAISSQVVKISDSHNVKSR